MTRSHAQPGSRWIATKSLLLLGALLAWAPLGTAQTAQPVPTGGVGAPALPEPPPGSVPTVAKSQSGPTVVVEPTLPGMPAAQGEEVDRVVAIVNGQLILDSDVDRERRVSA